MPVAFIDKQQAEFGDKVILPPSALDRLGGFGHGCAHASQQLKISSASPHARPLHVHRSFAAHRVPDVVQSGQSGQRPLHALWRSGVCGRRRRGVHAALGACVLHACMTLCTCGRNIPSHARGAAERMLVCRCWLTWCAHRALLGMQMMQNLLLQVGDMVKFRNVSLPKVCACYCWAKGPNTHRHSQSPVQQHRQATSHQSACCSAKAAPMMVFLTWLCYATPLDRRGNT